MGRVEIFPPELLRADKVEDVVKFLLGLECRAIDRKELLCDWCSETGHPLTPGLVERVYRPGKTM